MVQVVKDELVYMVYPIPATTELNVVLANKSNYSDIGNQNVATGTHSYEPYNQ